MGGLQKIARKLSLNQLKEAVAELTERVLRLEAFSGALVAKAEHNMKLNQQLPPIPAQEGNSLVITPVKAISE